MLQKKILSVLIASLLLVGCGDATNESTPTSNGQQVEKTSVDQSQQMALKARKGNMWLAIFEGNYSNPSSTLGQQVTYGSDFGTVARNAESYLTQYSDKNGKLILKNIRKSKGVTDSFFMVMGIRGTDPKSREDYLQLTTKLMNYEPAMPELDEAGKNFSDSYVALARVWSEFRDYYKTSEEYKLDDFAKSADLHDKLMDAYKNYQQASINASIAYNTLYNELHDAQKADLKAKGLTIAFNVYDSLDQAQSIVDLLNKTFTQQGNFKEFDKASLEQMITQLESLINELKQVKGNKEAIKNEGLSTTYFDRYVDAYASFIVQSKIVLRDLQEKNIASAIDTLNLKFKSITSNYNSVIN